MPPLSRRKQRGIGAQWQLTGKRPNPDNARRNDCYREVFELSCNRAGPQRVELKDEVLRHAPGLRSAAPATATVSGKECMNRLGRSLRKLSDPTGSFVGLSSCACVVPGRPARVVLESSQQDTCACGVRTQRMDAPAKLAVRCVDEDLTRMRKSADKGDDRIVCGVPSGAAGRLHPDAGRGWRRWAMAGQAVEHDRARQPGAFAQVIKRLDQTASRPAAVTPPAVGPAGEDIVPVNEDGG